MYLMRCGKILSLRTTMVVQSGMNPLQKCISDNRRYSASKQCADESSRQSAQSAVQVTRYTALFIRTWQTMYTVHCTIKFGKNM